MLYPPVTPTYAPPIAQPPGFNGFAIAGFVLSLCACFPLGIIFAIIALVQMRRSGERGRGLAIAGLVISIVWILCLWAVIANGLGRQAGRDDSGQVIDAGDVSVFDLRVGDCIESLPDTDRHYEVQVVPCMQLHEAEVYAVFDLPGSSYPGEDELFAMADEECFDRLESYSSWAASDPSIEVYYLYPTSQSWRVGDREVTCIAISTSPRIGSIQG
ncbi:MAG: DUF4190 domain-containing protein [Micromonosporaceae bacterium]|nr:DUF4190 domain-containing protein [Micromonosporaceae bacterium]